MQLPCSSADKHKEALTTNKGRGIRSKQAKLPAEERIAFNTGISLSKFQEHLFHQFHKSQYT